MKSMVIALALIIIFPVGALAADVAITGLGEATEITTDDLTVVVDAPSGSATTKKISMVNLLGKVKVVSKSSAYTLGTDNDLEQYGGIVLLTGAAVVTLPSAVVGMSACVYANTASAVSVKAGSSDHWIMSTGTALDNGDKITQTGTQGFVCFVCLESNHWFIWGYRGTWADDGA